MTAAGHDASAALVKMANDIADFFRSEQDRALAVAGIVDHLTRFWEPRMRRKILAHLAQRDGEGLSDLARSAVARLAEKQQAAG